MDWAQGLDVPVAEEGEDYDILYWVGCAASYDRRARRIARAMVKILKTAGVKFAVMAEERCHAEFARRLGEEYLYQTAAQENIENFSRFKFKELLTACPHCFNTLKMNIPPLKAVHLLSLTTPASSAGFSPKGNCPDRPCSLNVLCGTIPVTLPDKTVSSVLRERCWHLLALQNSILPNAVPIPFAAVPAAVRCGLIRKHKEAYQCDPAGIPSKYRVSMRGFKDCHRLPALPHDARKCKTDG